MELFSWFALNVIIVHCGLVLPVRKIQDGQETDRRRTIKPFSGSLAEYFIMNLAVADSIYSNILRRNI